MQENYAIQSLEQLRAISDPLRVRIADVLREQPMTATQLGEALKVAPAKVHYHVRELEKVGLLQLVETREKGGILEKYYQPIARNFTVPPSLLLSAPPDEVRAYIGEWFDEIRNGFLRIIDQVIEEQNTDPPAVLASAQIYITKDELKQLAERIGEIIKPYEKRQGIEGEQEIESVFVMYPQEVRDGEADTSTTASLQAAGAQENEATVFANAVGLLSYNKQELENILASGKRLNISVVGIFRIARDVSPELVDRAIEKLSLIDRLEVPEAVREVVASKRV